MLQRLAILGFGDVEIAPVVSATLSNFFADRPVEIRCWDENREACDVMSRVLRAFLKERELKYPVLQLSFEHTIEKADALIQIGDLAVDLPQGLLVPMFRLAAGEDDHLDKYKFQALRWINQEDDPMGFMYDRQNHELLDWLNSF